MKKLDAHEVKIVRALIRNPRQSDNQIAKKTGIHVMTVNRKRKRLEEENLIRYYTSFDSGETGTEIFPEKQLYTVKFKIGITRKEYLEKIEKDPKFYRFNACYISMAYLGEKDGHLALILVLDAKSQSKLVDEFNGKIVPHIRQKLGEDAIREITSTRITNTIRRHHNYLPFINMKNGVIKEDWPEDYIFVDEDIGER